MNKYTAIGLMSGTSMDGIDIAMIVSDGKDSVERGPNMFVPYGANIRDRIIQGLESAKSIASREQRPGELGALENDLTSLHAEAVIQFLAANNFDASKIDLIGFHGQTVLHRPKLGLTVQLGGGQKLADATGIDVVYDMRANDMVHGGQGAPLVPIYHQALARKTKLSLPLAFVNIGGISNVTYVGEGDTLIAFDCGPGNALIDQWVKLHTGKEYDEGGELASKGNIIEAIVSKYLAHQYFNEPTPKSLDRNDFAPLNDEGISLFDGARTLAHVTARAITKSIDHFPTPPAHWIISGGGALNATIVADLRQLAGQHGARVKLANEVALDPMALEAEAFAYLAIRAKLELPLTWPNTTGCINAVSGGVLVTPR